MYHNKELDSFLLRLRQFSFLLGLVPQKEFFVMVDPLGTDPESSGFSDQRAHLLHKRSMLLELKMGTDPITIPYQGMIFPVKLLQH